MLVQKQQQKLQNDNNIRVLLLYTRLAYSASSYMEAKPGACTSAENNDLTPSTCAASEESWARPFPHDKDVLLQAGWNVQNVCLTKPETTPLPRCHVNRMDNVGLPKKVLYGELATGSRPFLFWLV
ncbi:hypothetical protein AC249_AIPGENE6311 [Exaiptasia diaphana]|nr:hypothetical protein AC249_AIPGENE6311 [Exaiptasia diaphana]